MNSQCKINSCSNKVYSRGFCQMHNLYDKGKAFEPSKNRKAAAGEAQKFFTDALNTDHQECIDWPFKKSYGGRGQIKVNGKMESVTREIMRRKGILTDENKNLLVLHKPLVCNNGSCINHNHLMLGTQKQNMSHRLIDGTDCRGEKNYLAKVSEADVLEIYRLSWSREMTQKDIGNMFGITQSAVHLIKAGKNWSHLTKGIRK